MRPEWLWDDPGGQARAARAVLTPASLVYRAVVAGRNALFDARWLATRATAVPALAVGNLSVGGTGKTPIAADLSRRLREAGGTPALILRGYGDDEARVHALLNPDVPVLTSADRVSASGEARARGCDVVVLDDAFQHRWAGRVADVVLVAAEQWPVHGRLLPIGPYREPLSALRRATLVIVTRKTATRSEAERIAAVVAGSTSAPVARVAFLPGALRRVGVTTATAGSGSSDVAASDIAASDVAAGEGAVVQVEGLRGSSLLAVAGIGAPRAFAGQLEVLGASVELVSFPDHHAFSSADVSAILRRAPHHDFVVCTLKDAVKLAPLWPRASTPLWYVSQRIALEDGEADYVAAIQQVLAARPRVSTTR
jgi:tetraacyldisaccharide 4'-kinase